MQNVVNAHSGLIDFGLMRFREHDTSCNGPDAYCCQTRTDGTTLGRPFFVETRELMGGVIVPEEFRALLERHLGE
jgi:hypothetical protein